MLHVLVFNTPRLSLRNTYGGAPAEGALPPYTYITPTPVSLLE